MRGKKAKQLRREAEKKFITGTTYIGGGDLQRLNRRGLIATQPVEVGSNCTRGVYLELKKNGR